MANKEFSPQESFLLINNMIAEARDRFVENGHIYVFWGAFIFLMSFSQYILIRLDYGYISYFPYFLVPLGVLYSFYYYRKYRPTAGRSNQISRLLTNIWIVISVNMTTLGFFFFGLREENLIPVLLLLSGVGISISGVILKERMLTFAGILSNVLGLATFWMDLTIQPLMMATAAIVSLLIPGLWLRKTHKVRNEI